MVRNNKKGSSRHRRRGDSSSSSSSDDEDQRTHENDEDIGSDGGVPTAAAAPNGSSPANNNTGGNKKKKKLDFAERRERQRAASAAKRKAKMRCHLCGKTGHVRRECPGIDDDGRGESKYTHAKGDRGARVGASSGKKGAKNRGRKKGAESGGGVGVHLERPAGFDPMPASVDSDSDHGEDEGEKGDSRETFLYFDASCDCAPTVDYLRSGRGKNKLSLNDAVEEYQNAIAEALESSNYGGCIVRSFVKPGRPWDAEAAYPLDAGKAWFVVGFANDVRCDDDFESDAEYLAGTVSGSELVVGVFCDLDYAADRDAQTRKLLCTLRAAGLAGVPIQIRTTSSPAATSSPAEASEDDLWLAQVLTGAAESHSALKVHLACWSGGADYMNQLLRLLPDNVWLGFDGAVSFGKASHLHECAFDVPLSKLLLETGAPSTIPSKITKAAGRDAFCHSGHIPFVAEALAERKASAAMDVTAEDVARAASSNTLLLYPSLVTTNS